MLKAFLIAMRKSALNDQLEHCYLSLFGRGIKSYLAHIVLKLLIYLLSFQFCRIVDVIVSFIDLYHLNEKVTI